MRTFLFSIATFLCFVSFSQSTDFPLNHAAYQIVDLEEIRSDKSFSSTIRPYSRESVYELLGTTNSSFLSKELRRYTRDSTLSKRSLFNTIYKYPADFYFYQDKSLDLHFNPLAQFSLRSANDKIGTNYISSRGVEVRGTIDDKISFYTAITENQARYPEYVNDVRDSTLAIPYQGFWKQYKETGVDYLWAQGYIDFGLSQSISAQLGYGKHFIGNGQRSLILSNYANNYPYLRINTNTKIFDYTNIFAELIGDVTGGSFGIDGVGSFSKKYMAFHHLNVKIKPNLHIGLFESVIYGAPNGGLKVQYLNPVIFYRSVEQQNGSDDNAFVGLDFKWNIKNRYSLYGQVLVDEMVVSEVLSGNGWWGNKQGFQIGLKYVDAFGVKNLMLQGEANLVRPYTYAHADGYTSYSHYNLALAHPLGANFTEYLGRAIYRLNDKWTFEGMIMAAQYGNDLDNENYGRDILKDYTVRRLSQNGNSIEYGNDHLQGNKTDLLILFSRVTFMVKHNVFIDADATIRKESDANGFIDLNTSVFGFSFRWNMPARKYLF